MSNSVVLQYAGFENKEAMREYTFVLHGSSGESAEYFLTIPNAAFVAHRVRYQDAPDICSLRVHREFADRRDPSSLTTFAITDEESADYKEAHTQIQAPHLYAQKAKVLMCRDVLGVND
jgi:hypothetical protein